MKTTTLISVKCLINSNLQVAQRLAVPFPCSPEVILNVTISIIVVRHTVKY